jgi:mannosyltransferase
MSMAPVARLSVVRDGSHAWSALLRRPAWLSLLLLLQLPVLGHEPLVRDEVMSNEAASRDLGALWSALHHLDAPLGPYYAFLHLWVQVSDSATWLRLPSLLGMTGAIAVATWTAQRLAGAKAGLVTALLLLANPAAWVFAADARPYALALCAASVTLLLTLTSPRRTVLLFLAATATVYLQGLFVLLLVAEGVILLRRRQLRAVAALAAAGVTWLPLALVTSQQTVMTTWIPYTSPISFAHALHELFGSLGLLSAIALLAWAALAVLVLRDADSRHVLLLGAVPAVVLVGLGLVMHVLGGRYVLYVLLTTAIALGVATDRRQARISGLLICALLFIAAGVLVQQAQTPYRQDDLPAAAKWLVAHDRPGDALLYSPDHARAAFLPELQAVSAMVADQDLAADDSVDRTRLGSFFLPERPAASIRSQLRNHQRVWVVGYPDDRWRPTANTGGDIADTDLKGWTLQSTEAFGQIRVKLFTARVK